MEGVVDRARTSEALIRGFDSTTLLIDFQKQSLTMLCNFQQPAKQNLVENFEMCDFTNCTKSQWPT